MRIEMQRGDSLQLVVEGQSKERTISVDAHGVLTLHRSNPNTSTAARMHSYAMVVLRCQASREGDEWVCWTCGGLRWAVDDSMPEAAGCVNR